MKKTEKQSNRNRNKKVSIRVHAIKKKNTGKDTKKHAYRGRK